KEGWQGTNLKLESYKEEFKGNQMKIKVNEQLPYFVSNIVDVGYYWLFCISVE
ncbi:26S protease regulatory subunit 6A-like protein, partial [Trifolium medium]|nr:26S protease regulatory subunit 6A-like protein [Trifolium medium]